MKFFTTAAALGIAVLASGIPLLATAATQSADAVQINNVQIETSYGVLDDFAYRGQVFVAYTNMKAAAATEVIFDLESADGTLLDQFKDVGSIKQGSTVHDRVNDDQVDNNQQLVVDTVQFADGTTWVNSKAAPSKSRRQSSAVGLTDAGAFPFLRE